MHKDKGYFIPIIDIGVSYDKEDINKYIKIGNDNNLFIKSGYTKNNLIGKLLFGKALFPDFFNLNVYKLWNARLDDFYNEIKYDDIWLDKNGPSNLKNNGTYIGEVLENEKEEEKCNMIEDLKISYLRGFTNNMNKLINGSINMNGITYINKILYNIN
jgi:alpha-glucosidase (family GH31 glycosyl hydrolase)